MLSFSEATEFRLPLALAPGAGEAGFAPFRAPLRVGIWLCGPSAERISRDAGGRAFGICEEEPFLLDLKRKDIIVYGRSGVYERLQARPAGRGGGYSGAFIGCRRGVRVCGGGGEEGAGAWSRRRLAERWPLVEEWVGCSFQG